MPVGNVAIQLTARWSAHTAEADSPAQLLDDADAKIWLNWPSLGTAADRSYW